MFLLKEKEYINFCNGSTLKNRDIKITLPPDVVFRLERMAEKEEKTLEEYILDLIFEESKKAFPSNKDFYKKFFE